jgi:hypothetical protein
MTRLFGLFIATIALLAGAPGFAQTKPTPEQLERMITQALQEQGERVRFARPQIMGFNNVEVYTKQLGYEVGDTSYYFAVTTPRLKDGLFFFTNISSTKNFRMHRTDTHLRRVASALNDGRNLTVWAGPEADADMARQLAFWASHFK